MTSRQGRPHDDARTLAACLYPRNSALRGAFVKGALAAEVASCPYVNDGLTWSTAFAHAWHAGRQAFKWPVRR